MPDRVRRCLVQRRVGVQSKQEQLARGSFGRSKGVRLGWMDATTTDLDGKPRLVGKDGVPLPDAYPDLGCYESCYSPVGLLVIFR